MGTNLPYDPETKLSNKTMENVHNGVLLSHKEGHHYIIYREIDGTGEHDAR